MGTRKGWDEPGDWNGHVYIVDTMDKIGQEWGPPVAHRGLCSELCGDLHGKESQERGVYVHISLSHFVVK